MGKTVRFDPSVGNEADGPSTPFNPVLDEALKSALVIDKEETTVPSTDGTQAVVDTVSATENETVQDVLAAAAADQTVDEVAPSGDEAPVIAVEQARPPKSHRVERGPRRETKASAGDLEVRKERPRKEIPMEHFCNFQEEAFVALVAAIRDGGSYPVVRLFADVNGESSSIEFGLTLLPGARGECQRVGMTIVGGEGIFRAIFGRCKFFRDELFGYREPTPERSAPTTSLRHLLDFVLSLPSA